MTPLEAILKEVNRINPEGFTKFGLKKWIIKHVQAAYRAGCLNQLQSQLDFLLTLDLDAYSEAGQVNASVYAKINSIQLEIAQLEKEGGNE